MRKQLLHILLIGLFVIVSGNLFAQGMLNQRNQAYLEYRAFKDTMSIRTWSNMVELSKRLEKVVLIDNALIDSVLIGTPANANLELRISELGKIREQLIKDNTRLNQSNFEQTKQYKLFYTLFVVSVALLIIVLAIFVYQFNKSRSIKKSKDIHGEDISKLKHFYDKEITKLKKELINIQDEKELIDNSSIQIRKSYDVLKDAKADLEEEKKTLEHKLEEAKESEDLDEIRSSMQEMSLEVAKIMEEKRDLELHLGKVNHELKNQQEINKEIEASLGKANQELSDQIELNKEVESDLENIFKRIKKD